MITVQSVEACSYLDWLVEGRRKGVMGILEFDFSNGAGSLLRFEWIDIVISNEIPFGIESRLVNFYVPYNLLNVFLWSMGIFFVIYKI